MKKIALLGATGQTGKEFLQLVLNQGYEVHALVRDPEKLPIKHAKLHVFQGDVLNADHVLQALNDCSVVVSLFGHVKSSPQHLQTQGTQNIVAAMQQLGIQKIISLSGGALPFSEKDKPKMADHIITMIMKMAVPKVINDAIEHHKVLEKSGLQWIIVRGPRLTNQPAKGTYRVGWVGVNASTQIARADLADFIIKQIEDSTYIHQMPFVSY